MKNPHVLIGVCAPLSGLAASLGKEMKQAIDLAVQRRNREGGLAGHEIEVITYDDGSDVGKAGTAATELTRNAAVLGVIGHYSSDTSLAAARIYEKAGLSLVAPIASNPSLTESGIKGIFRYTNRDDKTAKAIANYLFYQRGKRRAILVATDSPYGNSMSSAFKQAFTQLGGTLVRTFSVRQGEKDFRYLVQQFPDDFDLLFYGGTFEGAPLLNHLRSGGYDQLMATGDGCWDKVNFLYPASASLEKGEGVVVLSASAAVGDVEGSAVFAEAYTSTYGEIINYALNSYDCANILFQAIEDAARSAQDNLPDRNAVRQALQQVKFRGIANGNPAVWDEKGDNQGAITKLHEAGKGQFVEIH